MKIKLEKRHKYIIHSLLLLGILYYFSGVLEQFNVFSVSAIVLFVLVGSYVIQKPNSTVVNTLATGILPASLTLGFILSLIYFPNLSNIFKLLTLAGFAFIYYLTLLVNNVFLVVESREETIPLYRVALTWSKILIVTIAIPLLAGVFKVNFNSFIETLVAGFSALLFYTYLIWSLRHNHEIKKYKIGELIGLFGLCTFFVMVANLSVSFFPTETFLRALFVSSIMIFCVSYIEGHLKNIINKRLISEHLFISIIFLVLLFIFNP